MRIISSIKSFSHFKEIIDYVDGITIGNHLFMLNGKSFEIEEMKDIIKYAKSNNKDVFLDITLMCTNKQMDDLEKFILQFKDLDIFYIYGDLGVFMILKKYNLESRGVYDPKTMITNSKDLNLYLKSPMLACSLSLEMPLKDVLNINKNKCGNIWYKVFGYHQMFHSKRKLISSYAKYKNISINLDNDASYLKEETRDELYHIVENEHGTILYRSYIVSMLECFEIIKDLDYLYLDCLMIDESIYNECLKAYYNVLKGNIPLSEGLNIVNSLIKTQEGFMYEDTVYVKPEVAR